MGLECVVNVSEGRDPAALGRLAAAAGGALLDVQRDPDHDRSVLTLAGDGAAVEEAARAVAATGVAELDLGVHAGSHPRFGVVDVVPFVPLVANGDGRLDPAPALGPAVAARDRFARWAGSALALPCFCYGPLPGGGTRSLPEVRRLAFRGLAPDAGPERPHPTAGSCAVGARGFLVAYNLWLDGGDVALARAVAREIRGPAIRALGLDLSGRPQVSCNLVDPLAVGPAEVHDRVARLLGPEGATVDRCELVGLLPGAVLAAVPRSRWEELGLAPEATVEARMEARGVI